MPEPILVQARYRNKLEASVGAQLSAAGVSFEYEPRNIPYKVPARDAKYLLDFGITDSPIIIETKGWFGRNGAKERQKLVLVKQQHPELDIRLVFSDANKKIYKGSKTTYAMWATENGFTWADKGVVPQSWIDEMKHGEWKKRWKRK